MKLIELAEPELQFASGSHICPRHGIALYTAFDATLPTRSENIVAGVVGTSSGIEAFEDFVEWSSKPVNSTSNNLTLHPPFCGMSRDSGFGTYMSTGVDVHQLISQEAIKTVLSTSAFNNRVESAVKLYLNHIDFLCSTRRPDVVVCVLPEDLFKAIRHDSKNGSNTAQSSSESLESQYSTSTVHLDFRALLKAKAMALSVPLQIVHQETLDINASGMQVASTRAWNLCTALYFKANTTAPWKLEQVTSGYSSCFVGISFFKSLDKSSVDSSTAQVFDELGRSVIMRGRPASITANDKSPYLVSADAYSLIKDALSTYRHAVRNAPARLVVHKTSRFLEEEVEGIEQAAKEENISMLDLVTISGSKVRMYRERLYPPLRGSLLELSDKSAILYTRGSVPFFKTYPGGFVPEPLSIQLFRSDRSMKSICNEILGLTKMNWNNTQFDNKNPITLGCARRVGEVVKYLEKGELPRPSYAFYM